jgi:hypothetical protein
MKCIAPPRGGTGMQPLREHYRDKADVAPLRGVIRGGQAHPQVAVTVEPLEEARARGL